MTQRVAAGVGNEPRTALQIAADVRGPIEDDAMFFVVCEVLGHLDELPDAGAISEHVNDSGVRRFAAA